MYYKLDENGKICAVSVENYDGQFLYTDKNIVENCRGEFLFEDDEKALNLEEEKGKYEAIQKEIRDIRLNLTKWKEDIEQVELFGMDRDDYEEKKQMCKNAVLRLRELEKQL